MAHKSNFHKINEIRNIQIARELHRKHELSKLSELDLKNLLIHAISKGDENTLTEICKFLKSNNKSNLLKEALDFALTYFPFYERMYRVILSYYTPKPIGGESSPLHIVAQNKFNDVLRFLVEYEHTSKLINTVDENKFTPLHYAVYVNNIEGVATLLDHNANPTIKNNQNLTPLHLAAISGNIEIALMLLKKYPDLSDILTNNEDTHLHLAAEFGNIAYVKKFIKPEDFMKKNIEGNTIIHLLAEIDAISKFENELKSAIAANKINLNIRNNNHLTPLIIAINERSFESALTLIKLGATLSINDVMKIKIKNLFYFLSFLAFNLFTNDNIKENKISKD